MFDKSKVWKQNALLNLESAKQNSSLEDAFFDIACFDAQQALEFILKAILMENNIEYQTAGKNGHDILYLSDLVLEETDFVFEKSEDLTLLATTITSWEEKGRYYTGIKTKEETVRRVLNIYESISKAFTDKYL